MADWRCLGHRVAAAIAGVQTGEAVPAGVGRGRFADGTAECVGAGQGDCGAWDGVPVVEVVRLPAVVVLGTT